MADGTDHAPAWEVSRTEESHATTTGEGGSRTSTVRGTRGGWETDEEEVGETNVYVSEVGVRIRCEGD